ncbi:MAG TPA: TonB-dependent receptor [Steroidobacteraceae bacterium]|jgi:outer membrane receptor protein involved in Fe transport|nr:TonB-dependent receptor [Steroidobacteraceae bacterium]
MAHSKIRAAALAAVICASIAGFAHAAGADADANAEGSVDTDTATPKPRNAATATELPQVTVIGNTPLEGLGLPLNQIPGNVQTGDSREMRNQQTVNVADYLNTNFSGINASASADNPFQLDINYHGFTASPLLGTPEGLSVYVDGVRVNESFGDTVNWDLIPQSAISTVTLMSGSNPVFGLNTLGGALSIRTKSGHDDPGTELEASGGSFGRRAFEAETGGELGDFDYFLAGNYFDETGWRDNSPSRVYQLFGKVGWQTDATDLDLSYTYADTSLYGNGAVPVSMLDYRWQTSYTPDYTENLMSFLNLTGTQFLSDEVLVSGNVYYRHLTTSAINGNVNDSYLDDGYGGPPLDCAAPAASRAAMTYCLAGQNATSQLAQDTRGFGVQITDSHDLFGRTNQAVLGIDYADSSDRFSQQYQFGSLSPDRLLIYQTSPLNDETVIALGGSNKIYGAYFTDTFSPTHALHLNLSVRYNRNTERLDGYSVDTDVSDFGSGFDDPSALTGDHTFSRVNPALGFTVTPSETLTLYANYNEASRAPTVVELGCANPAAPCGLPNDFASDPALEQVIARTVEAGMRGNTADKRLVWSADVFHTTNDNDIQFVATAANAGYFANVGNTRRQGIDLAVGGTEGALEWHLTYSYVDATFQSNFAVSAESNSTADADGNIDVRPGDRIPLIPRHTGRLVLNYKLNDRFNVGGNVVAASGEFLHGNENNANQAGGTNGEGAFIAGSGWLPGYAVVNLQGSYHLNKRLELFAHLANLFDKRYATAGFLTSNSFNPNGSFIADPGGWSNENAVAPAAPRAIWVGARVRFE